MIRKAKKEDLKTIEEIYEYARDFMKKSGNPTQWGDRWPLKEVLEKDIEIGQLYVAEDDEGIYGVFAFIIGDDETYKVIENGAWLDDSEYGTIHRAAGSKRAKGLMAEIVEFCQNKITHLRIDTHENNKIMRHVVEKLGFKRCGIIVIGDGTPRIAYEKN